MKDNDLALCIPKDAEGVEEYIKNLAYYEDVDNNIKISASPKKLEKFKEYFESKNPTPIEKESLKISPSLSPSNVSASVKKIDTTERKKIEITEDNILNVSLADLDLWLADLDLSEVQEETDKSVKEKKKVFENIENNIVASSPSLTESSIRKEPIEVAIEMNEKLENIKDISKITDEKLSKELKELTEENIDNKYIKIDKLPNNISQKIKESIEKSIEKTEIPIPILPTSLKEEKTEIPVSITKEYLEKVEESKEGEVTLTESQRDTIEKLCNDKKSFLKLNKQVIDGYINAFGINISDIPKKIDNARTLLCALIDENFCDPFKDIYCDENYECYIISKKGGVCIPKEKSWSKNMNEKNKIIIDRNVIFGNTRTIRQLREKLGIENEKLPPTPIEYSSLENNIYNVLLKNNDTTSSFIELVDQQSKVKNMLMKKNGPYTIFVPSNNAIKEVQDELLKILNDSNDLKTPNDLLKSFLYYHIISKSEFDSTQLIEESEDGGAEIKTRLKRNNKPALIEASVVDNKLLLNNKANVINSDIKAKNGIIHIIDKVLFEEPKKSDDSISPKNLKNIEQTKALNKRLNNIEDLKEFNLTPKNNLYYRRDELEAYNVKKLLIILKIVFGRYGKPTSRKEDIIEYILATQNKRCNKDTNCEDGKVCDVSNSRDEGVCVPDREYKGPKKFCIVINGKKFTGTKRSLKDLCAKIGIGPDVCEQMINACSSKKSEEKVTPITKKGLDELTKSKEKLTPITKKGLDELTKSKEKVTPIVPESVAITPKPFKSLKFEGEEETKEDEKINSIPSPVSVPQLKIKNVDDIEKILSSIQSNIDVDPSSVSTRVKEEIARCLGLIP